MSTSKYFNALLGKLFHAGRELKLRGGINFKSGFVVEESDSGYDVTAVGEGGVLSNDNPSAVADPQPGVSTEVMRSDASFGTAIATGSVGARHGFFHSDDKRDHDTMVARAIYVNPTGVYATDESALNAAAVRQRTTHLPIKLGQGQFNVRSNQVDWTGLLGAVVEGVGKSAPSSAATRTDGTTIKCVGKVSGVSQRAAGSWLINMNGSQYCRFKGISFVSGDYTDPDGACETLFRQQIGDGAGDGPFVQPESNTYEDCGFEGVLNYVSTSTTSRKLVPGTIVWSGVTGTWPTGSRVVVYSASGDAIGYGTVSSFSGGNIALAITKARNNGAITAHTDWRFYQSAVGVTMPLASNTAFVSCHISGLEHFADVSGSVNSRMQNCIISQNSMLGHTLIGSQTVVGGKFDFVVEPGIGGWGCGADISTCLRTELNITSGDSYSKGELLEITGCRDTRVNGVINSTAAGSWLIRANGTENLKVEGYADATGGYGIAYLGLPSYLKGNPTLTITGNTITRSAGTWDVDDLFAIGDSITVYNSTSNNVTRNVTNISGGGAVLTVDGAALTNETAANICVLTQAKTNINLKPTIDWPMFTGTGLYLGVSDVNFSQLSWRGSDGIWHSVENEAIKVFSIFGQAIPFTDLPCDVGVGLNLKTSYLHITTSGSDALVHGISPLSDPGAYAHLQALGYFGAEPGLGVTANRLVMVHDSAVKCTFFNESATDSTASRRLLTGTGANLVLPACRTGERYVVVLVRYPGISRWFIEHVYGPNMVGVKSIMYAAQLDNGNSGTTKTIDLGAGSLQKLTLTGNCALTTTAPIAPCAGTLYVYQDATGGRTLTFPTSRWPSGTSAGGVQPSTGASELTVYDWEFDGTTIAWTCRGKMVSV